MVLCCCASWISTKENVELEHFMVFLHHACRKKSRQAMQSGLLEVVAAAPVQIGSKCAQNVAANFLAAARCHSFDLSQFTGLCHE